MYLLVEVDADADANPSPLEHLERPHHPARQSQMQHGIWDPSTRFDREVMRSAWRTCHIAERSSSFVA